MYYVSMSGALADVSSPGDPKNLQILSRIAGRHPISASPRILNNDGWTKMSVIGLVGTNKAPSQVLTAVITHGAKMGLKPEHLG